MSRELLLEPNPTELYPKFTCPQHKREKFVRVCTHPNCEKQLLLCGGCLLDDPEHGIEHKPYMRLIKDFIETADEFYTSQRNRTYKSSEVSPELLEFVNDFEKNNEMLAKRFLEESQTLDLQFELCIKELIDAMIALREEIKARVKRNFEIISENYKFVMDKVKNFYNLVTEDELVDLYPTKDVIYTNLYSSETYIDCETYVKKIKGEMLQGNFGSPKKQKDEQKKRLETKNQLLYLSSIIRRQIGDYRCFDFEEENIKKRGYEKLNDFCKKEGERVIQEIKANITMHEVEKCLNMPKEALSQVYEVKDYDITDEAINQNPLILHFFKQNTQNLFVLDLSKVNPNSPSTKVSFDKLTLNIDFKIPYDHASVCLPTGTLYLSGGTDYQKYFKEAFEYSLATKKISKLPPMKRARSNHGICYIPEAIYVIGGYDGSKFMAECERYDIVAQKWLDIAPLNVPTACAAVCAFQEEYIYKIGGIDNKNSYPNLIERYHVDENIWTIINVQLSKAGPMDELILGESAECAQINNRQLILFGGKHKNTTFNSTYLLDIDGQNVNIKQQTKFKLPFEEYFKCPKSVVVTKGCVYAVSYYMRKVFAFNSYKWNQLN